MPEEDKKKDSDRVKPLEAKPGGKEKGTRMLIKMEKTVKKKEE